MEEVVLHDGYSKVLNALCHFKIVDDDLVITMDFGSKAMASWEYLRLIGQNPLDKESKYYENGQTTTEIVEENYERALA